MSCLNFNGTNQWGTAFTPISAELGDLPNGAGTMAFLLRLGAVNSYINDLMDSGRSDWFHALHFNGTPTACDDDGIVGVTASASTSTQTASADNYQIYVVDWPSGGAATERFHWSGTIGSAESWTHSNSTGNNGGNRAGVGTSGKMIIGCDGFGSGSNFFNGDLALMAIWAGVRFSDSDATDLWVNKKTTDWYNHPAGTPTMLVECTSTTLVDIGGKPSTFSAWTNTPSLTAADPTGWTFDGQGFRAGGGGFARPGRSRDRFPSREKTWF